MIWFLFGLLLPPALAATTRRRRRLPFMCEWTNTAWRLTFIWALTSVFTSHWHLPEGTALSFVIALACHDHTGRRKRAAKLVGDKARLALARLADAMRGLGQPVPDPA